MTKKAEFDIDEGDKPPDVAQKLADDFNGCNKPSFCATPNGANVRFTAYNPSYEVRGMRFSINNQTENLPGNGASVAVGNTGVSVKNASG